MTPRLVLASASPRRKDLLAELGLPFDVRPTDVDETPRRGESPEALVARLAASKADAGARAAGPDAIVLGADTVVAIDDDVLGKPADAAHAAEMLRCLAGQAHRVLTGVAVAVARTPIAVEVVTTYVAFRSLTADEIAAYVATGEPLDKAGAYGIQGQGGALVASIEGPYDNVVGLPLERVRRLLTTAGIDLPSPP